MASLGAIIWIGLKYLLFACAAAARAGTGLSRLAAKSACVAVSEGIDARALQGAWLLVKSFPMHCDCLAFFNGLHAAYGAGAP